MECASSVSTGFLPPPLSMQGTAKNLSIINVLRWKRVHISGTRVVAFVRALKRSPPKFVQHLFTLGWRCREALNMAQIRATHLVVPSHVWMCALSLQVCSRLVWLPHAKAETFQHAQAWSRSPWLQTSFCTCFADGVLVIQLSCQPNDTVLPFCELRCTDRSLLVSARIYSFPRPITCFIKLSRTI